MAQYRIDSDQYLDHNKTTFEVVMIGDQEGNIVNTFGAASNIIISAGQLAGYSGVSKFGLVEGTSSADFCTVWTLADTVSTSTIDYSAFPGTVTVTSNASDTGDIIIEGLDTDYNEVTETLSLTGTSTAGSQSFHRIFRAYYTDSNTNAYPIIVSIGGTNVTEIDAQYGQTLQAFYTIPAGKTGYLMQLSASASKNQETLIGLFQRPFGQTFRISQTMALYQSNQTLEFAIPIKFVEKTDLEVRTKGATNATISTEFSLVLVDNA
jgi:hypothetical protein